MQPPSSTDAGRNRGSSPPRGSRRRSPLWRLRDSPVSVPGASCRVGALRWAEPSGVNASPAASVRKTSPISPSPARWENIASIFAAVELDRQEHRPTRGDHAELAAAVAGPDNRCNGAGLHHVGVGVTGTAQRASLIREADAGGASVVRNSCTIVARHSSEKPKAPSVRARRRAIPPRQGTLQPARDAS